MQISTFLLKVISLVFLPIKITLKRFLEGFLVKLLASLTKDSYRYGRNSPH